MIQIKLVVKKNPRILATVFEDIFEEVAPNYIQPILEEGIADGSIHTESPKEMAEVLMILCDLWLNPILLPMSEEDMKMKCRFIQQLASQIIFLAGR